MVLAGADTLIGQVLEGRFEIRDRLGQGGMGTVYRAWQRSVEREVAIKLIDRSLAAEPMAVERFTREAKLASQLSHPNTISVVDFGALPDGRFFIAMELVRGRTLGKILRSEGAMPLDRVIRIGIQICDALAAAHAVRIVHRDLKPDNIMLLDGTMDLIKVLDFGLAKRVDDASVRSTAAGVVVGTPRYIAPETAMTGQSSPAGDVYALGVILAELATGKRLWEGDTLAVILQHQVRPEPSLQAVPTPLRRLVASLVDPKPERRPTPAMARQQLMALQSGAQPARPASREVATVSLKTERPNNRRWLVFAGAGAAVFIGTMLVVYTVLQRSSTEQQEPPPDPLPDKPVHEVILPSERMAPERPIRIDMSRFLDAGVGSAAPEPSPTNAKHGKHDRCADKLIDVRDHTCVDTYCKAHPDDVICAFK